MNVDNDKDNSDVNNTHKEKNSNLFDKNSGLVDSFVNFAIIWFDDLHFNFSVRSILVLKDFGDIIGFFLLGNDYVDVVGQLFNYTSASDSVVNIVIGIMKII